MKAIILLSLVFSVGTSYAAKDQCATEMNRELELLGMGTYANPAKNVDRQEGEGFNYNAIAFRRSMGSVSQVISISDFFANKRRIYIQTPSVVFGGGESKELVLNEKCRVESFYIVANGLAAYITPEICKGISESHRTAHDSDDYEAKIRAIAPGTAWISSRFWIDTVESHCEFYKDQLAE